MARTLHVGPLIVSGAPMQPLTGLGAPGESNPDSGPSIFNHGMGILDKRFWFGPGGDDSEPILGWGPGCSAIPVLDQVPSTAAVNNIAVAAVVVALTAMTLVAATGAGITVGVAITRGDTLTAVTGLLGIDYTATGPVAAPTVQFGSNKYVNLYDPTGQLARAVSITASATATGVHFIVNGYDIYGFPMSENILAVTNSTVNGKKAFKFISSVIPQTTDNTGGHTYSIGTADVYGLPLRADSYAELLVYFGNPATPANNFVTAATGFVKADATSPATATTGDTRGTITAASDGTKRLSVLLTPWPSNVGSIAGLTGITPA